MPPDDDAGLGDSSAPPRRLTAHVILRRPGRRLIRAYSVTCQVAVSYLWLRILRRFRTREGGAELEDAAHRKNARRIKNAIVELQGLFIKVGQLISIMANFLPEAFRKELEELQDKVPPRPYEDVEARLREEFGGRGPDEVFASFDKTPVASASIGQVHEARLASGERVAVKIQYPDIEAIVRTDLRALRRIFWVLGWLLPEWGFDTIYREIREMVLAELDYRQEAEAIGTIAGHFTGRAEVLFPHVKSGYSTARVITTEWMDGIKVADVAALDRAGVDRRKVARLFVESYCKQIFEDGVYHADPHPGNLLVQPQASGDSKIVFLDFGATGRVSEKMRKGMLAFLGGAMTRDTGKLIAAMKEMGFISRRAKPEAFERVVEYFHDRLRAEVDVQGFSLKDIKFDPEVKLESLLDLRQMNVSLADLRDSFNVPKDWVLLERTLLLLLGVCTTLDPEMNPAAAIKPYLGRFLVGPEKNLSEAAVEATRDAALAALALPGELRRFFTKASLGEVEVRLPDVHESARLVYTAGQQLLWGILGATAVVLAVVFDGRGQSGARAWATFAASVAGLLLVMSLASGRGQTRR
jgi:predicted unusual protein kinase regulating ubiquinone biosynthesis (AarF/ABC1/UbiB family)